MSARPNPADSKFANSRNAIPKTRTRDREIWINVNGHATHVAELATIFGVNVQTLRARIAAGWPVESACLAGPMDGWKINNVHLLQDKPWVIAEFSVKLDKYFDSDVSPVQIRAAAKRAVVAKTVRAKVKK